MRETDLERAHDGGQGGRGVRREVGIAAEDDDAVDVVGHDDEGIECDGGKPLGQGVPGRLGGVAGRAQPDAAVDHLPEHRLPGPGADGDEVESRLAVVVPCQSRRAPSRPGPRLPHHPPSSGRCFALGAPAPVGRVPSTPVRRGAACCARGPKVHNRASANTFVGLRPTGAASSAPTCDAYAAARCGSKSPVRVRTGLDAPSDDTTFAGDALVSPAA